MLGALLQGIEMEGRAYSGDWFDWLSPFSLFCSLALVFAYVLLGSCWLMMKLPNDLTERYEMIAKRAGVGMVACIAIVSIWLPLQNGLIFDRWFSFPNTLVLLCIPALSASLSSSSMSLYKITKPSKPTSVVLLCSCWQQQGSE